ncbi:hypothetical protein QR680_011209 [Steinernema hermaphroditum]|uniref:RING-CH-type domain-containing protein n=1 Tax=Steinernema hermaphroditum TaxID=289476 RepID=A0AA39MBW5_9BILA|nr:hypothetical protein QR680_011209 [Steinernema hermaphroditum]
MAEDGIVCRICYSTVGGPVYQPCKCRGTLEHVHFFCWERWVDSRRDKERLRDFCDICRHRIKKEIGVKPDGDSVTWAIYLDALFKYTLSFIGFKIAIYATVLLPLFLLWDVTQPWTVVLTPLTVAIGYIPCLFRHFCTEIKWNPKKPFAIQSLPDYTKLKDDKEQPRIRDVSYKTLFATDMLYYGIALVFAVGVNFVAMGAKSLLIAHVNPMAILEYVPIALVVYYHSGCLFEGALYRSANRLVYDIISTVLARNLCFMATFFFDGCVVDFYKTCTFSQQLLVNSIASGLSRIAVNSHKYYCHLNGLNHNDTKYIYYKVRFETFQDAFKSIAAYTGYTIYWHFTFIIGPVAVGSLLFPSARPIKLGYCEPFDRNSSGPISADVAEFNYMFWQGVDMTVKLAFIVCVQNVGEVCYFFHKLITFIEKMTKTEDKFKNNMSLDMTVWTTGLVLTLTAYYAFTLFLGRVLVSLVPAYFTSICNDDIMAFVIACVFYRIFYTSVINYAKALGIALQGLLFVAMWYLVAAQFPVTVMNLQTLLLLRLLHEPGGFIFTQLSFLRTALVRTFIALGVVALIRAPAFIPGIGKYYYFCYLPVVVLGYTVYQYAVLYRGLMFRLKLEYDEYEWKLVNYKPEPEAPKWITYLRGWWMSYRGYSITYLVKKQFVKPRTPKRAPVRAPVDTSQEPPEENENLVQ